MKRGRSQEKISSSPSPKRHHHTEISESNGIHIPLDLTVDILSRLPVKSLVKFQIVSKLWSSLIIDSIVARSFTQPRLFLKFPHWLLHSSLLSSSTPSRINNISTLISAAIHSLAAREKSCDFEYQYIRGLICCADEFADIFLKTSKRQQVLLPEYKHRTNNSPCDRFLGYDPMENQVFTLFGGLKKQQWKRLNIQGIWNQSPKATSSGLCINGIIYYIECINIGGFYHPDFNELVWFDISFERFGYIKMPITLELSPFEELVLVNYKGKLGCLHYNKDSAEMWTMEDHNKTKQQEWSKIVFSAHDLVERLGYGGFCIAGATPNGEIVIMPRTLEPAQPFYAFYYDPKQNRCAGGQFERFLGELKSGEVIE